MPYLNKLTPESHLPARPGFLGVGGDILNDLIPEFSELVKNFKLKEHRDFWLLELEKFLRRLRVVSLKMDRISDSWIKKIRKGSNFGLMVPVADQTKAPAPRTYPVLKTTVEDMKKEEQKLIIEIAKTPKDSKLYETLGDLYVKMDSLSDAKESFEAAVELSPNSERLRKKLSKVQEKVII